MHSTLVLRVCYMVAIGSTLLDLRAFQGTEQLPVYCMLVNETDRQYDC